MHETSAIFIELGAAIVGLAILARIASQWGFSAVPLYLVAGLAFGNGGIAPIRVSDSFIHIGGEIGVLLLLFMLGLEFTGAELKENLRGGVAGGIVDFLLNFSPGVIAGLLMQWSPLAAVLLGGITYISSSGIIAKVLSDLKRLDQKETSTILSILVTEDLAMAIYLPIVSVLLVGGGLTHMATSVAIAIGAVALVFVVALRYGSRISAAVAHESDEVVLLTTFGAVLLVAGLAQEAGVSAAIGAFLVGIAASDSIAKKSHRLLAPLRDLFAATFFFFFGIQIDPHTLPAALPLALALGVVTSLTKVATGYWASRRTGVDTRAGLRAGMALVARGEFSIVIAGLGAGIEPRLGPLSAAYVLILAIAGPLLTKVVR